jgi:hypothetical protein
MGCISSKAKNNILTSTPTEKPTKIPVEIEVSKTEIRKTEVSFNDNKEYIDSKGQSITIDNSPK